MLLVTYRLWLPPTWTQTGFYPAIPFFDVPTPLITWVSMGLLPIMAFALAVIFASHQRVGLDRCVWFTIACALALGFLTDQHRLQPWAYQSFLYACWFVLLPTRWWRPAFRTLTISIYFFSSIGKLDYQFLHTVGQEFLDVISGWLFLDATQWSEQSRVITASAFPLSELAVACLLMLRPTRLLGGCLAIGMHATLIVLLSPLGLDHSLGVLAWNAVLAGQAYWLFIHREGEQPAATEQAEEPIRLRSIRLMIAAVLMLLALTLPLTERRGRTDPTHWHWDHWLSWSLYSPHNSRVQVEIYRSVASELPPPIRATLVENRHDAAWYVLDLGKLSLEARGVPVLPQARYQLKLAIAIAKRQGWTHQVRAILRSTSDRRSGEREERWMNRLRAMEDAT